MERKQKGWMAWIALIQGAYYLVTGIWPILSRRTFEMITGPKVDFWLVRTIGALISVIGAVLSLAGLRGSPGTETALLGIGSAASLGGSDIIYASRGRISRVYLVESLVEVGLIALWVFGLAKDIRWRRASMLQLNPEHGTTHRV